MTYLTGRVCVCNGNAGADIVAVIVVFNLVVAYVRAFVLLLLLERNHLRIEPEQHALFT